MSREIGPRIPPAGLVHGGMREENLALDGRALQSSSKGSPGGDEAPEDKKGRECSDRPVLSPDLRVSGVSTFGQVESGRSGGGSCGERKGEGSVPRGLSPTPGTCHFEGSLVGEGRGRPVDPTHLAADLHPCNGMSSPRELEDVARESGVRDDPIEAPAQDGGSVSRVCDVWNRRRSGTSEGVIAGVSRVQRWTRG